MLSEEEVKQVAEELGKSIVDGDKYGIVLTLFDYLQSLNNTYVLSPPVDYNEDNAFYNIYGNHIVNKATDILKANHIIMLQGHGGTGKTSLAHYLVYKLTGCKVPLHISEINQDRACFCRGNSGIIMYSFDTLNSGMLNRFINHIETNKITEPCCFVCDEVQVYGVSALFGGLIGYKGLSQQYIPENLYIICVGLLGQHIVEKGSIEAITLSGINKDNQDLHKGILKYFGKYNSNLDDILNISEEINSVIPKPLITIRNLVDGLSNNIIALDIGVQNKDFLSDKTMRLLQKLSDDYNFIILDKKAKRSIF